jgi:hypothetical protein
VQFKYKQGHDGSLAHPDCVMMIFQAARFRMATNSAAARKQEEYLR